MTNEDHGVWAEGKGGEATLPAKLQEAMASGPGEDKIVWKRLEKQDWPHADDFFLNIYLFIWLPQVFVVSSFLVASQHGNLRSPPGIQSMFTALQGRLLTTGPQGKSPC